MKAQNYLPKFTREKQQQAQAVQTQAIATTQDYRRKLEKDYGIPIVMESLASGGGAGGTVRSLWDQRTRVQCHSIDLAPCEPWARGHKLAHELTHIHLECEAFAAGVRRTHVLLQPTYQRFLPLCEQNDDPSVLLKLFSYSLNAPLDLVVEARLQRDFPVLHPAQFVDLYLFDQKNVADHLSSQGWDLSPRFRQAFDSLVALRALFLDVTIGSPHQHFARFEGSPAGPLARQMFDEFQAAFSRGMAPGGHYALVDRCAEIIGLAGLHDWVTETAFEIAERMAGSGLEI